MIRGADDKDFIHPDSHKEVDRIEPVLRMLLKFLPEVVIENLQVDVGSQ